MRKKTASKIYLRDGRAPIPVNDTISRVMSANKGKSTKPELLLRKALWSYGFRGYRVNWKKAPGRPDIAFIGKKLAIFVNGCFWHRCPLCNPNSPKSNIEFWENKFLKNSERDNRKNEQLKNAGWTVITIWECEIKNNLGNIVEKVRNNILNI
jgi:DNA mismatch endonuclease (patch repair protein)